MEELQPLELVEGLSTVHGSTISVNGVSAVTVYDSLLMQRVVTGEFNHIETYGYYSPASWDDVYGVFTNRKTKIGQVGFAQSEMGERAYLERKEAAAVLSRDYDNEWHLTIACNAKEEAATWIAALDALLPDFPPPPEAKESDKVPVEFWMQNPMTGGAYSRHRWIQTQTFEEIKNNYPAGVRSKVERAMGLEEPEGAGKLILFHGPPGTGKTRSILSLFREWKEWCNLSVVTDPERFAGDATYLNDLLFDIEGNKDWLLIVIEDGDNFVNVDSRDSKGEAIGRLLNVADGIIGQGLNVLTLISTNVKVNKLNEAMARPGRCLSNIYFPPFSVAESLVWLQEKTDDEQVAAELLQTISEAKEGENFSDINEDTETPEIEGFTLAELYAALR